MIRGGSQRFYEHVGITIFFFLNFQGRKVRKKLNLADLEWIIFNLSTIFNWIRSND